MKIGPEKWREVLEATKPEYCEVWFRVDQEEQFREIFKYLQSHNIEFGLHLWAILPEGYEPNLAFEPEGIADQAQELIKQNIDIARRVGAHYVNIHPGSLYLQKLDLDQKQTTILYDREVDEDEAWKSLLRRSQELNEYAQELGILFLVETLPRNELKHGRDPSGRVKVQEGKNISLEMIEKLAESGINITNDFCHTACQWNTQDREVLFQNLLGTTKRLARQTRLIHLNTMVPPLNGTDSHNGILEKDFAAGAFPSREQIKELLRIFKDRDDVWLIPEPEVSDMAENYFETEKLLGEF